MANRVLILRWAGSAYDSLGGLLELTAHELAAQGFEVTWSRLTARTGRSV